MQEGRVKQCKMECPYSGEDVVVSSFGATASTSFTFACGSTGKVTITCPYKFIWTFSGEDHICCIKETPRVFTHRKQEESVCMLSK